MSWVDLPADECLRGLTPALKERGVDSIYPTVAASTGKAPTVPRHGVNVDNSFGALVEGEASEADPAVRVGRRVGELAAPPHPDAGNRLPR